ncbi:hypothetical protein TAMC210_15730 [Thermanaeromonas sp. C210]|nr:hypothetical protein TAMC210_15730 [Thermanaeromonas sp. C210]
MEPTLLAVVALSVLKGLALLLSYLSNNTLPQPLSEQEEQYYLERIRKGDREARNVLIEHNLRLVAHITKKFEGTGEDIDDLISIGTIGLIKAINTFNSDKGTKLATYAARCIENEISLTKPLQEKPPKVGIKGMLIGLTEFFYNPGARLLSPSRSLFRKGINKWQVKPIG